MRTTNFVFVEVFNSILLLASCLSLSREKTDNFALTEMFA